MAVPKFRTSKRKRNTRRSHHRLRGVGVSMTVCTRCDANYVPEDLPGGQFGVSMLSHRACPKCGLYKNRKVPVISKSRHIL